MIYLFIGHVSSHVDDTLTWIAISIGEHKISLKRLPEASNSMTTFSVVWFEKYKVSSFKILI